MKQKHSLKTLGRELTAYFLVNPTGYKSVIGFSNGFNGGFCFVGNPDRIDIVNLRSMHNYIRRRVGFGFVIEDSEGNIISREELFSFAAYSRGREIDTRFGTPIKDDHGFPFVYPDHQLKKAFYATLSRKF